ncbi:serine hydrolase [Stenotrophomonas sp. GD03654]|uniref:D-alanyl-D-alanine carboxypeptidase family protein n=1 Tax=Stenotrophomonas sp. GD03654 TaxID=2975362 RepID=UPI002447ADDD|nr:serine hydrolase [Stenotrophomonas sp. GD03654]MDH2180125.1 serine hydrolase [Stenotrophomonas sp. GD03654]
MTTNFKKTADTPRPPASIIKLVTALVMRRWISDPRLSDTVTVVAADMHPPTTAGLQAGDVISWRDLAYGLLVPSGNDASLTVGRLVGEMILASEGAPPGNGLSRFIAAMNSLLSGLAMEGAVAFSTHGVDTDSRLTARQAARLMVEAMADPFLLTVMGTLSHVVTITGVNARTYSIVHTINPDGDVKFPEFLCGKTGSYASVAEYCLVMGWSKPDGGHGVVCVLRSPTTADRFVDARKIIDFEKAIA